MDLQQRVEWRDRRVAWERMGSGPPVVFCHGTPFSSRVWAPFAEALVDQYSVYLWDMPGYGQSSKTAEHAVDFGVQGELLADLIGAWGLDRTHVIARRDTAAPPCDLPVAPLDPLLQIHPRLTRPAVRRRTASPPRRSPTGRRRT